MTLKQSQGHQILNDAEQGYNHTTFEKSHFDSVPEKGNVKFLFKQANVKYLLCTCVKNKK